MLYFAEIRALGPLPSFEIESIELMDELPSRWTYPQIQPFLMERVQSLLSTRDKDESMRM